VVDLQKFYDGNQYDISETTGTPGQDLKVDFVNITKFTRVFIIGYYDGGASHSLSIQLYHWDSTSWHTWDSMDGIQSSETDQSFNIPCWKNYIGTGGDAGKVRVRFVHTQTGNNAHNSHISVVQLYDTDYRLDRHWGPWR
jgi:hypothetical protein